MKRRGLVAEITSALLVVLAVFAAAPQAVVAATLRVERDGTGNFLTIQAALDAAASGDTVLIGTGEFTEYSMVRIPGYSWDVAVFAYSELPYLTIIGAGAEQTFIGPAVPMLNYDTYSAKCLVWNNGTELHLRGVTLRNCYDGLHVPRGSLQVDDCVFVGHAYGIIWQPQGAGGQIHSVSFASAATLGDAILVQGPASNISLTEVASTEGGSFYFSGAQGVDLSRCDLAGGVSGLSCVSGSSVAIRDCHLHGASNQQLYVYDASCSIDGSILEGGDGAVSLSSSSSLIVTGSVLSGSFAAIASNGATQLTIHGSHILRAGQWSVWANGSVPGGHRVYDLTNNYWGTANASDIAAWIWDSVDNSANWGTVNYLPFSSQEVPTESTSWGGLKALFR